MAAPRQETKAMTIKRAMKLGYNVAIVGPHGIGKTYAVREWARRLGARAVYCNLAAMAKDDFSVPVPDGDFVVYKIHEIFKALDDEPSIVIIDEFNRNRDNGVYNVLMELLMLRSIHGKSLNIHSIVALMNPDDDDRYFNTAELEEAIWDRFNLFVDVWGYDMQADEYLLRTYPRASAMVEWFLSLPRDKQILIPPRRQEFVLRAYEDGFPIEMCFRRGVDLPLGDLMRLMEGEQLWTLNRMLEDPERAAAALKERPSLQPLFYAFLRIADKKQAMRLIPVVKAVSTTIRQALLLEHPEIYGDVMVAIGSGRGG